MFNLLFSISTVFSDEQIRLTAIILTVAFAVLVGIVVAICLINKKKAIFNTKKVVFAGITLATSFALSFIKFAPLANGGSVTFASFVPILIYAYVFGPTSGLLVGMIYGVLQFLQAPYVLTIATFFLDYILAFGSIFLMGYAKRISDKLIINFTVGTVLVFVTRFIFHFFSGLIYWLHNSIWVKLPTDSAILYSFLYQMCYVPFDMIICVAVFIVLCQTKTLEQLIKLMKPTK